MKEKFPNKVFLIKRGKSVLYSIPKVEIGEFLIKNKDLIEQIDISVWSTNPQFPNGTEISKDSILKALNET